MKLSMLLLAALLFSCSSKMDKKNTPKASMDGKIVGVSPKEFNQLYSKLEGKMPKEANEMIGTPAFQGYTKRGSYHMVYLAGKSVAMSEYKEMDSPKCYVLRFFKKNKFKYQIVQFPEVDCKEYKSKLKLSQFNKM